MIVFRVHSSYWVSFFLGFSIFRETLLYIVMNTLQSCMPFSLWSRAEVWISFYRALVYILFTMKLGMPNPRYLGLVSICYVAFKADFFFNTSKNVFLEVGKSDLSGD